MRTCKPLTFAAVNTSAIIPSSNTGHGHVLVVNVLQELVGALERGEVSVDEQGEVSPHVAAEWGLATGAEGGASSSASGAHPELLSLIAGSEKIASADALQYAQMVLDEALRVKVFSDPVALAAVDTIWKLCLVSMSDEDVVKGADADARAFVLEQMGGDHVSTSALAKGSATIAWLREARDTGSSLLELHPRVFGGEAEQQQRAHHLLEGVGTFSEFDVFALAEACGGRPLQALGYSLIVSSGLHREFGISEDAVMAFLEDCEAGHPAENAYHCSVHAADVLQTAHSLVLMGPIECATALEVLAVYLAAIIHDLGHTATSNAFHIATHSELATRYHDQSVLEQHSLTLGLALVEKHGLTRGMKPADRTNLRQLLISLVLATDIGHHLAIIAEARSKADSNTGVIPISRITMSTVLKIVIKIADISNPAKPLALYQRWAAAVMSEFWSQGDKEKALGLPVSNFMDRSTDRTARCQVGFISFLVEPLFHVASKIFTKNFDQTLVALTENKAYWAAKI
jgi:hypothetical protein